MKLKGQGQTGLVPFFNLFASTIRLKFRWDNQVDRMSTMLKAITIAQKIEWSNGHSTGFDYLRVGLSLAVVLWHTVVICYGADIQGQVFTGPLHPFIASILPMFFALSGFLVCGSLERCRTLISFLSLRALRIFPALMAEVILSALLLGPLLSALPLREYLADPALHVYFLNMLGIIHYYLPGLFADNPLPGVVNNQLWTVPYELDCYLLLSLLAGAGIFRFKGWLKHIFPALLVLMQVVLVVQVFRNPDASEIGFMGQNMVLCFLTGVALFKYRHIVLWHWSLAIGAAVLSVVLLRLHGGANLYVLPISYLTVYLGLLTPKVPGWLKSADYSYGLYLYSFPIQQAVALIPGTHVWYINLAISLPLAGLAAMASWHLLEKHVMAHKKVAYRLEAWLLETWARYRPVSRTGQSIAGE